MINPKMIGLLVAAFVAGSFFASPELRAYASTIANDVICSGCVGTSDLAGSAVTNAKLANGAVNSAKIADNSITAADIGANAVGASEIATNAVGSSEIATDAVGAAELQGVTKLLFGQCVPTDFQKGTSVSSGTIWLVACNITGVDADDSASATLNNSNPCFEVAAVSPNVGKVIVYVRNDCPSSVALGGGTIAVIVYDK